jgi:hypothetical protein
MVIGDRSVSSRGTKEAYAPDEIRNSTYVSTPDENSSHPGGRRKN